MGTGAPSCARNTQTPVLDPGAPGLPWLSSPRRHGAAWSAQGTFQPWGQEAAGSPGLPRVPGRGASPLPEPVVWSEPCPCPVPRTHLKSLD